MTPIDTGGEQEAYLENIKNTLAEKYGEGINKLTLAEQERLLNIDKALEGKRDKSILLDPQLKAQNEERKGLMEKIASTESAEE